MPLRSVTPILDVKPYVAEFDSCSPERTGWLLQAARRVHDVTPDRRFEEP